MSYRQPGIRMGTDRGQHSFAQVPAAEIQRSVFDRSCGYKTAFDGGFLYPIFVDEVLPGDTMQMNMTGFGRLATLIHPIIDNCYIDCFFFFVPNRLVWDNWERFCGAQDDPGDTTDYLIPQVQPAPTGFVENGMADYFGLPTKVANQEPVNALPFRAYNLIWNEWFRDENMQNSKSVPKGDGPDTIGTFTIEHRGKRHDYFTSCLPFAQKGDPVALPLGSIAPVITGTEHTTSGTNAAMILRRTDTNAFFPATTVLSARSDTGILTGNNTPPGTQYSGGYPTNMYADLEDATAASINQIREAFQIQRLLERDARGGTRYTEILRSHFRVTSPDARLQRPEYLGGGSIQININPIAATDSTSDDIGDLGAAGTFGRSNIRFRHSATEHGHIIGLIHLRADLNYQQGQHRMWSRQTRYDIYWPALAHLGEQAVLNKEIYTQGTADDQLVFGYQERWAEYRYKPSQVTAQMRSNHSVTLDSWHLAEDFETLPTLNNFFIQDKPPFDRVIAVPSEPACVADFYFDYKCARPMPVFSVPGLIDHF